MKNFSRFLFIPKDSVGNRKHIFCAYNDVRWIGNMSYNRFLVRVYSQKRIISSPLIGYMGERDKLWGAVYRKVKEKVK